MVDRELIDGCAEAVQAGAAELRARWGTVRTIDKKGTIDLVTDADRASETAILAVLRERFPGAAILAEESGASGPAAAKGGLQFYVDPLDGTTNYAHGLPHFNVTVAVADGEGLAAAATIDPMRGELFLATRGGGATLNGLPIRHAGCASLEEALLVTGFPYDVHRESAEVLRRLAGFVTRAQGIRRLGAAALDLAYVACGRLDGYWEGSLKPWDSAAGILICREAGAVVSDFEGGGRIFETGCVVACAPGLHARMLEVLAAARRA